MFENFNKNITQYGYHEIINYELTKKFYYDIYSKFDLVDDFFSQKHNKEAFDIIAKEFNAINGSDSAQYTPGYMRVSDDHPENKYKLNFSSFQFTKIYYEYIKQTHNDILNKCNHLNQFLTQLEVVDRVAKSIFTKIIGEYCPNDSFKSFLYGNQSELSVLTKVWKYNESKFGAPPHYDKTAFSLLLDNNDDSGEECLVLGQFIKEDFFDHLKRPLRKFQQEGGKQTSTLIIAGILLKELGFDMNPTPHAVLPILNKKVRYSIVSFCLIPKMDTKKITHIYSMDSTI